MTQQPEPEYVIEKSYKVRSITINPATGKYMLREPKEHLIPPNDPAEEKEAETAQ